MSDTAIKVENLSKLYRIGMREHKHETFMGALTSWVTAPLNNYKRLRKLTHFDIASSGPSSPAPDQSLPVGGQPSAVSEGPDLIWALKDVSFDVKQGEVVGVIGHNGAGKSTLLKILSRITEPTHGRALINGRIASLLEVGTGFHPDLTGRENIYLNGTILGMAKKEVDTKFDEIVDFAEVEKFIDTPVKHYSSGMYVRLAFAVAAHLESEILLVDEVLAVGDMQFQKKCIGRMNTAAQAGRTTIFVSHQMNQIRRLCQNVLWLSHAKINQIGPTIEVVSAYETAMSTAGSSETLSDTKDDNFIAQFRRWEVIEPDNEKHNILTTVGAFKVGFVLHVNKLIRKGRHGIALLNQNNQLMWGTDVNGLQLTPGEHQFIYSLPTMPLQPGIYFWRVSLFDENGLVDMCDCIPEFVIATQPFTHSRDEWAGILNIPYMFSVETNARRAN